MIRALRYVAATVGLTVFYGTWVLWSAWRGVRYERGGLYDRIQFEYGRRNLAANRMTVAVEGLEDAALDGPVVFVSNHLSWVDIWALLTALPGSTRFVFKKELSRIPFLGPAINAMGHISIDRGNRSSAFASYDRSAEQIRRGTSAIVFAEGTRSLSGKLLPFKKGPFVLAIAAQVPVVPVVCVDTFERLPKRSISPRPGPVVVRVGRPIPTAGLDYTARDRLADEARAAMLAMGAVE
ncbi:MAG: lysophospholipid acyltransferase family protein [Gemmatimonadales bacterium]